jgi:tetratricopeptide (TPR) repeat protein
MRAKIIFFIFALSFLLFATFFFIFDTSYQKSLEARFYYALNDYDKAYTLADEAFALDGYNRMAATIKSQSKIAMRYLEFIEQAKEYLDKISILVTQRSLSHADKLRIKMMSEVVLEQYKQLAPTVMTDDFLINEAQTYEAKFAVIYEKVTSSL